jgi:hypothetical protein
MLINEHTNWVKNTSVILTYNQSFNYIQVNEWIHIVPLFKHCLQYEPLDWGESSEYFSNFWDAGPIRVVALKTKIKVFGGTWHQPSPTSSAGVRIHINRRWLAKNIKTPPNILIRILLLVKRGRLGFIYAQMAFPTINLFATDLDFELA